ncbi:hypothetical protein [Vibrio gallaecicus]|uniref:hypothetical protein n=1 Tax=Vibrio gallaecicus TaxID=552386 RepID=UPI0025B2A17E|nr:hypothetical protein [Vibrio gallaecicus]MDN3613992.1 hypothetical protein [Vibrio gallaecicus]
MKRATVHGDDRNQRRPKTVVTRLIRVSATDHRSVASATAAKKTSRQRHRQPDQRYDATFTFGNIDDDVEKVEVFNGTTLLGEAVKVEGVWTFTATDGQLTEGANSITGESDGRWGI